MDPAPPDAAAGAARPPSVISAWARSCTLAGACYGAGLLLVTVVALQDARPAPAAVPVFFLVIGIVPAIVLGALGGLVTGLLNGVIARALPQAGWFAAAWPTAQRRLTAVVTGGVTVSVVLATRPSWIWLSVTPLSLNNPVFVNGDPGLVDGCVGAGALAAALIVARLSRRLPPMAPDPAPPAPPAGRRAAAVSTAAVVIAAGAAVSLAVTAVVVPADITRPEFFWQPAVPGPAPAAGPVFAVALSGDDTGPATVYQASGYGPRARRVGAVAPPPGEVFDQVMALGDDRTFVLGTMVPSDAPVFRDYELRLGPGGRPGPLTQIRLPPADDVAFSPDGGKVAAAVVGRHSTEITVLILATGARRTWSAPGLAGDLSWAGDREIAFMWSPRMTGSWDSAASLRLLDTAAPGRSLLRSRVLLPASVRAWQFQRLSSSSPVLVAGNSVFAVMTTPRGATGGGPRTAVVEFSARTGLPQRVLGQDRSSDSDAYCGIVWADPSAQHVLTSCGSTVSRADGAAVRSWQGSAWDSFGGFAA